MAKVFIGIDPGLTNTALAYLDEQGRYLGSDMVKVTIPPKMKRAIEKKRDKTNIKLRNIFNRVSDTIDKVMKDYSVTVDDIVVLIEGFWFRPPKPGERNLNNHVFETVAGITATKCALFLKDVFFFEIMPVQLKRVVSFVATGIPEDKLDKKQVQGHVETVLGKEIVESVLSGYAKAVHEHLTDAMAAAIAAKNYEAYTQYMKIPAKKRKAI